jgi:hypothetical protein
LYKLYSIFDKELVSIIQSQDIQFHLSGLLSYLINHNWVKNHQIIELVETNQLWNFKEYDRTIVPKDDIPLSSKCASILEKGFLEPLILSYDNGNKTCLLEEGNHRLLFAKDNNIPFVPVLVRNSSCENGHPIPEQKISFGPGLGGRLCASSIGFNTFKKFPEHPYLPSDLSSKLKSLKFANPYDIGYETLVLKLTNPGML